MNKRTRKLSDDMCRTPVQDADSRADPAACAEISKPTSTDSKRPSSSQGLDSTRDRLVETFRVSKKMRPFVGRMRLRVNDLDCSDPEMESRLTRCESQMMAILTKKNIPTSKAKRAVSQILEIAADHQLQRLRQKEDRQDRVRSARNVCKLILQLQALAEGIAKLPPVSKGKLNAIVADHTLVFFDTETYSDLIRAIADALVKLSPKSLAQRALDVIHPAGVAGAASSKLIELWEVMPAATRYLVEDEVRRSPAKRSVNKFFRQLIVLLNKHVPRANRWRLPTVQRQYIQRVGVVWQGLGLKIGQAYDGSRSRNVESSFQRFARLALTAVGDNSVVSRRQVARLKKTRVPSAER